MPQTPSVTIGGPVSGGSDITLSWFGANGVAYGVQTNSDLVNGIWSSYVTNIVGNGGMIIFTNDIDSDWMFFLVEPE